MLHGLPYLVLSILGLNSPESLFQGLSGDFETPD